MNRQKGFTLIELVLSIALIGAVALMVCAIYVAYHFIAKFW